MSSLVWVCLLHLFNQCCGCRVFIKSRSNPSTESQWANQSLARCYVTTTYYTNRLLQGRQCNLGTVCFKRWALGGLIGLLATIGSHTLSPSYLCQTWRPYLGGVLNVRHPQLAVCLEHAQQWRWIAWGAYAISDTSMELCRSYTWWLMALMAYDLFVDGHSLSLGHVVWSVCMPTHSPSTLSRSMICIFSLHQLKFRNRKRQAAAHHHGPATVQHPGHSCWPLHWPL